MRRFAFLLFFLALHLAVWGQTERLAITGEKPRDEVSKLRFAASQYPIVEILVEEGKYHQVLPEFRKILKLGLKGEHETLVVQSAWLLMEKLAEKGQYSVAHQMINETLNQSQERENKFSLLMFKGKLFKDEGRLEEAIQVYRKAQELKD